MNPIKIAPQTEEELIFHGIPFNVERENKCVKSLNTGSPTFDANSRYPVNLACTALCFLGMTTKSWQCSEWWGQAERFYNYNGRLFIGDKLGRIHIVYEDDQEDIIPVLFGVNVWNYDLFEQKKEYETNVMPWSGPYREPFAHDKEAEKLFYDSMVCMENNGDNAEKGTKWTLVIKVNPRKKVKYVRMSKDCKDADYNVSAITAVGAGETLPEEIRFTDNKFYLRKDYYTPADRLARRLYQYRDQLPEQDPKVPVEGYDGPEVTFSGNGLADVFTNVYRVNLMDMAHVKVDDTGRTHTSSKDPWEFGIYCGMGTYTKSTCYYGHVWSRDVGRTVMEIANGGYGERSRLAVQDFHSLLYYPTELYSLPHWKRIANLQPEDGDVFHTVQGKENDGHASIMLSIYTAFNKGYLDKAWLREHKKQLSDAADWFIWQIENPAESGFDEVLCSNSEASTQIKGSYDLFSNSIAAEALECYGKLFEAIEETEKSETCRKHAEILRNGCKSVFLMNHPRYGEVYTDTIDDCWTYEYKRFIPLFIKADTLGYDIYREDQDTFDCVRRTFQAQKEDFYYPEAGRQMGYGQGYLTQTTLMLDDFEELTKCVEATSMFCYHHSDVPYMVPEGVILSGNKQCWYRNSDLGNAVQQAETIKTARLVIGLDDIDKSRGLRLIPRLPDGWNQIDVRDYCVTDRDYGHHKVNFTYTRIENGYHLSFQADQPLEVDYARMGPFRTGRLKCDEKMEIVKIGEIYFAYISLKKKTDNIEITLTEEE